MASKPILYGTYTSPGVNAVIITFKLLKVDFDFCLVRPMEGESGMPEYLKKNPTGTIPALKTEDQRFLGDSHAITAYIVDRYGNARDDDGSLYPRDLYKRAKVQQLQHFADSILFATCVKPAFAPIFSRLSNTVSEEILKNFDKAYAMMERFLVEHKWLAADHMTIADINCITCMYGLYYLQPFTQETHPLLHDWFQRIMQISEVYDTLMGNSVATSLNFL
ncbi:glutathione S-transferase 1, partial [Stomoxys calcitrans]